MRMYTFSRGEAQAENDLRRILAFPLDASADSFEGQQTLIDVAKEALLKINGQDSQRLA
jgi:hypothetical protein